MMSSLRFKGCGGEKVHLCFDLAHFEDHYLDVVATITCAAGNVSRTMTAAMRPQGIGRRFIDFFGLGPISSLTPLEPFMTGRVPGVQDSGQLELKVQFTRIDGVAVPPAEVPDEDSD
jgi:hypothetical protein